MNEKELINPSEYGIEAVKANELLGNLPQIQSERQVLELQYNEVIKLDIEDVETSKIAKELRARIRDNRTKGINVWHTTTKDFFLKGGQFVDAIKRKEIAVNERMESTLEEIEKYAERKEQARISELNIFRISEVFTFGVDATDLQLGNMTDGVYKAYLTGIKSEFEAQLEAERLAEEQRIEAEKQAEIERLAEVKIIELQRVENEKLKLEAEAREKAQAIELAKIASERKLEAESREKLEKELQATKDAEIKIENDRIKQEEIAKKESIKAAKAPSKQKLNKWIDESSLGFTPNAEGAAHRVALDIQIKFQAFKKWAKSEIERL